MSEFIAEAQVLVRPNTAAFRAQLQAQLTVATKGIVVPITVTPVAAKGVVGAAAATEALAVSSRSAAIASEQLAGAQVAVSAATTKSTASLLGAATASARLDAALLGLRTALGSTAVIGLGALSLGAIVAGKAISASLKNFASFQQELATFRVTAGATAEQMAAVAEESRRLGEDVRLPAVSAADAAVAMTELAKAGLSVEDAMAGARGVLELATAAQISNAEAANIAANALNAFGLAGDQATRVADDLANAANAAQGSISDFGFAFQQASAVARQVGLSLEDTTALLSLFAKNGLQGSDAGTSLRVALIRLVAPTDQAAAEIKKLGLNIRDAQGNVRPDVFAQFGTATRNLAPAARDAAAALIFGQDAIRAVSIGAREGAEGLEIMQFQIDQTGTAAEVAAARTEGLSGSFEGLSSGLATLSIDFGKLLSLGITPYLDLAAQAITVTNKLVGAFDRLATSLLDIETPLGRVGNIVQEVGLHFVPIVGQVREIRAGLHLLGIGSDEGSEKLRKLTDQLKALQAARLAAAQGHQFDIARSLTPQIEALKRQIEALNDSGKDINNSLTTPLRNAVTELEKVRDIRLGQNAAADVSGLNARINSLKETISVLDLAQKGALGSQERLRDALVGTGDAALASAAKVKTLTDAMADLTRQSTVLADQLQKAQAEGATPQTQIGLIQLDIAVQQAKIAAAERGGRQAGDITTIRKARDQIIKDNADIERLQNEITSDIQDAARKAKDAATKAQKARDEQFQAIAELFRGRAGRIEEAITTAGIRGNLDKEIRLNKALVKVLLQERKTLLERLRTLKVSTEIRKRILEAINKVIRDAQDDAIRFQQEQQQNIQDAINTRLDLRIQLAEAKGNVKAQIAAHRAKLEELRKELRKLIKQHKGNTIAALELRVAIAEEEAAIKDLKKQNDEKNKTTKELFFSFLQTQQGFAANLLGNLIPGFATAGLVGGSAAAAQPRPFEAVGAGPQDRASQAAALAGGRERGVRPIQVDTTNHLLRQIRDLLKTLNGRAGHPEARFQKATGGAAFDTLAS